MADETAETAETPGPTAPGDHLRRAAARPEHEVTTTPAPPKDDLVSTPAHPRIGRRTLRYTATTGRVVLREEVYEDGSLARAPAQGRDVPDGLRPRRPAGANRPVTFAFNGGPGSQLGVAAPRPARAAPRRLRRRRRSLAPPPYGLLDNAESLLAVCDLVFIDPVSTGYSRAVEGGKRQGLPRLHRPTSRASGELIRLWTTRHNRWMSPKFLAGESYGTLRAAALAEHLQTPPRPLPQRDHAHQLRCSTSATVDFEFRNDRAHVDYLPTYAADGPLPRQARPQVAQDRPRRGGGVCRARLPVGAVPGDAAHRRRARRARHAGSPR